MGLIIPGGIHSLIKMAVSIGWVSQLVGIASQSDARLKQLKELDCGGDV